MGLSQKDTQNVSVQNPLIKNNIPAKAGDSPPRRKRLGRTVPKQVLNRYLKIKIKLYEYEQIR